MPNIPTNQPTDFDAHCTENTRFLRTNDWNNRRYQAVFLVTTRNRYIGGEMRPAGQFYIPSVAHGDSQSEIDWASHSLRIHYHLTYAQIARIIGFSGESGARMAVNRYRNRNLQAIGHSPRGYSYQLGSGQSGQRTVTIDTRTFGIEIEFRYLDFLDAAQVVESATGRHCHSTEYHGRSCMTCGSRVSYSEWKVEKDSTVCSSEWDEDRQATRYKGGEAIAPIGKGDAHLDEISAVMRALKSAGASVDTNAGMHVHLNMKDMGKEGLAEYVLMWAGLEPFIFGLVSPSRRNNRFCEPMSITDAQNIANQFRSRGSAYGNRGALNITCYPKLGTFEIRMHQGTLNPRKMKAWVKLHLGLVQAVKERRHLNLNANLSVLGELSSRGYLDQQVGSYLFARHEQLATR